MSIIDWFVSIINQSMNVLTHIPINPTHLVFFRVFRRIPHDGVEVFGDVDVDIGMERLVE